MKPTHIIAVLAIGGLLVFIAVSVLGGSKDKAASPSTALRGVEGGVQPQIGDRYSVGSPLGTKSVPQQINYQGYLVNSSDTSAVTDTLEMTFKIYAAETGGSELWWETHSEVPVLNGLFNVLLGTPDSLFTGQALWLETTIEGETLSPRKKLVSVPYALKGPCWRDANVNDCVFNKSGSVGIGTDDPAWFGKLAVAGTLYGGAAEGWGIRIGGTQISPCMSPGGGTITEHPLKLSTCCEGHIILHTRDGEMRITDDGNVGIGTTSPGNKLHVVVDPAKENWAGYFSGDRGVYAIATGGAQTPLVRRPFAFRADVNTPISANTGGGFITELHTSNTPQIAYVYGGRFQVTDNGNRNARGIYVDLDDGDIGDYGVEIHVEDPAYAIYSYYDGKVYFAGNVGIGTTTPARKLHVNDVMRLQPRALAPSPPSEGDIYMDSNDHTLKVYDGTQWQSCW